MLQSKVLQIVRQFSENGMKLLLENPKNAADLLVVTAADVVKWINLNRLQLMQTTFVQRDYRHVESDVVLVAPLRRRKGKRSARRLLIYVMALVYHVREPSERPNLQETIESSVRTDKHRQEVFEMGKTIADELREAGAREGARQGAIKNSQRTLVRQLTKRFGNVPAAVSATIRATDDADQLDEWLDRFATAETLEDVGIGVPA